MAVASGRAWPASSLSRAVQALVSILGVSTIIFVVMHLSGDPTLLLVPEGASREDVALLRHQLGFDRPLAVQYADYLAGLARGPRHLARPARAGRAASSPPACPTRSSSRPARSPSRWAIGLPVGVITGVWRGRASRRS